MNNIELRWFRHKSGMTALQYRTKDVIWTDWVGVPVIKEVGYAKTD